MAKKKHHRKAGMTIPILPVLGIAVPLARAWEQRGSGAIHVVNSLAQSLLGYDILAHTWSWQRMKDGALPIGIGVVGHYAARPLNRLLASHKIPFFRF